MTTTFWLIQTPSSQRHVEGAEGIRHEPIICTANPEHRSGWRPLGALSVIVTPASLTDFAWTWASDILLSQRTLDIFAKHQVTGYEVRSVEVRFRNRAQTESPPLYELVVTGWGGIGAPQAGVRLLKDCPGCTRRSYSVAEPSRLIDPKAWDGSDIFMVWPLPKYRFVSDRLATLIRNERLTGVDLIPAAEIPMRQGADLSPGGLRRWMPDERARQIGEPLGIY